MNWPTALDAREVDHTLLSNSRGNLLPRNWPKEFFPIRTITPEGKVSPTDRSEVQSNVIESWSMSWWGFQKGRSAIMIIVETPKAGGWEGMKRLADACREIGYILTLHDQYRDYYVDAPSYDPQFCRVSPISRPKRETSDSRIRRGRRTRSTAPDYKLIWRGDRDSTTWLMKPDSMGRTLSGRALQCRC